MANMRVKYISLYITLLRCNMNKEDIDKSAEREAIALRKQGRSYDHNKKRIRQQKEYNHEHFNRLFVKN